MRTEHFSYELPEESIAVRPLEHRDASRLLVLDRGVVEHAMVRDWPERLERGALVVLNDTRVRRARVELARSGSGGRVELLFLEPCEGGEPGGERWRAVGRANRPLRPKAVLEGEALRVEIMRVEAGGVLVALVEAEGGLEAWLERRGRVPIPPYLRRPDDALDGERYQTLFAEHTGSVAAPTAGLHLSRTLLSRLDQLGIERATLTLDIGLGTFRPVDADDLDQHLMHEERFDIGAELVERIQAARRRRAPVVAVGTTVVRALESASDPERPGELRVGAARTRLLIQPGYRFRVVDALLTNFHQPKSTLLALVCAFAGREATLAAYGEAVRSGYRFLSYGDAMWIPRRA